MNKKGVERFPLRYVGVAIVASLLIAIALQVTNTIQGGVTESSNLLADKTTGMAIQATSGAKFTTGFSEDIRILAWSFNATSGTLRMSVVNNGDDVMNIDYITASFNDVTQTSPSNRELQPTEGTDQINFDLSSAASPGDPVSVRIIVGMIDLSTEEGTLAGVAE